MVKGRTANIRSPSKYNYTGAAVISACIIAAVLAIISLGFGPEPEGQFNAPTAMRLFYIHLPLAWSGLLGYLVLSIVGIPILRLSSSSMSKECGLKESSILNRLLFPEAEVLLLRKLDILSAAVAKVSLISLFGAMITGALWAKEEWGVFWRFDDFKLSVTLITFLLLCGYTALSTFAYSSTSISHIRTRAVFALLGFLAIPLTFISSRYMKSLHPNVIASSEGSISPAILFLAFSLALVISVLMLIISYTEARLCVIETRVNEIEDDIYGEKNTFNN